MKRHLLILVPALAVVVLVVAVGFAEWNDPDDLRARARQMQDFAELLESQGDKEAVGHLAEQAERMIHQADEMGERREREEPKKHEMGERREREEPKKHEMAERRERLRRDMDRLAHHVRDELSRER